MSRCVRVGYTPDRLNHCRVCWFCFGLLLMLVFVLFVFFPYLRGCTWELGKKDVNDHHYQNQKSMTNFLVLGQEAYQRSVGFSLFPSNCRLSLFLPPVNENTEHNEVRKRDSLDSSHSQVLSVSQTPKKKESWNRLLFLQQGKEQGEEESLRLNRESGVRDGLWQPHHFRQRRGEGTHHCPDRLFLPLSSPLVFLS